MKFSRYSKYKITCVILGTAFFQFSVAARDLVTVVMLKLSLLHVSRDKSMASVSWRFVLCSCHCIANALVIVNYHFSTQHTNVLI